jgi:tetratricopeptide (TPR) repeat protein
MRNIQDQNNSICPRCHMGTVDVMGPNVTVICSSCGWTTSHEEIIQENSADKKMALRIIVFAVLFFSGLMHNMIWGSYSLEILPLKLKHIISIAKEDDLLKIEKICIAQKRYSCLEVTYMDLVNMNKTNYRAAAELGHIQFRRNKISSAEKSYVTHFQRKGHDLKAAKNLASIYNNKNDIKKAIKYYELALRLDTESIPADLIRDYVELLARVNKTKQAVRVIEAVRQKGPVLKMFMVHEMNELKKRKI